MSIQAELIDRYNELLQRVNDRFGIQLQPKNALRLQVVRDKAQEDKEGIAEKRLHDLKKNIIDLNACLFMLQKDNSKKMLDVLYKLLTFALQVAGEKEIKFSQDDLAGSRIFETGDSIYKQLRSAIVATNVIHGIAEIFNIKLPNLSKLRKILAEKYEHETLRAEVMAGACAL